MNQSEMKAKVNGRIKEQVDADWIKTMERKPTVEDGDAKRNVLALVVNPTDCTDLTCVVIKFGHAANYPESYLFWRRLPAMPTEPIDSMTQDEIDAVGAVGREQPPLSQAEIDGLLGVEPQTATGKISIPKADGSRAYFMDENGGIIPACPGCGLHRNAPGETGRWLGGFDHRGGVREPPLSPYVTHPGDPPDGHEHEHQDGWVDCPGRPGATATVNAPPVEQSIQEAAESAARWISDRCVERGIAGACVISANHGVLVGSISHDELTRGIAARFSPLTALIADRTADRAARTRELRDAVQAKAKADAEVEMKVVGAQAADQRHNDLIAAMNAGWKYEGRMRDEAEAAVRELQATVEPLMELVRQIAEQNAKHIMARQNGLYGLMSGIEKALSLWLFGWLKRHPEIVKASREALATASTAAAWPGGNLKSNRVD